jgi:gas vesicle protein GvpA/GvpJ/GvpM family
VTQESGTTTLSGTAPRPWAAEREAPLAPIALVDLLDRLLGTGVVLAGDIVISLAGVDLVLIQLRALITSVRDDLGIR